MKSKLRLLFPLTIAALLSAAQVQAQSLRPAGYFVAGALAGGGDFAATGGLVWPWSWRTSVWGTSVTVATEASISHWEARGATRRNSFTHVALVPMFRIRPDGGRSPWFAEAGIGISVMDQLFLTQTKQFTTSFNFVDVVGVGRSFGPAQGQEISLRIQHVSNGGIRVPNPGQNFMQLRYASNF